MSVAGFLNNLLRNGWQLHLRYDEHGAMLNRSHTELQQIAVHSANELVRIIDYFEEDDLQIKKQQLKNHRADLFTLYHLAVENLTANLTSFPENWFLFDIKGNPICAVPNKELGMAFCEEVKQQHGIVLQCFNAFERFIPKSFKEWEKLNRVKDNRLFLRIEIALCKLQKHLFEFLIRSVF